jgi:hypothetical protein
LWLFGNEKKTLRYLTSERSAIRNIQVPQTGVNDEMGMSRLYTPDQFDNLCSKQNDAAGDQRRAETDWIERGFFPNLIYQLNGSIYVH